MRIDWLVILRRYLVDFVYNFRLVHITGGFGFFQHNLEHVYGSVLAVGMLPGQLEVAIVQGAFVV